VREAQMISDKISIHHLERKAILYIRNHRWLNLSDAAKLLQVPWHVLSPNGLDKTQNTPRDRIPISKTCYRFPQSPRVAAGKFFCGATQQIE
jgi:hypothetical protein